MVYTKVQNFCGALSRVLRSSNENLSKRVAYARMVATAFADLERLSQLEKVVSSVEEEVPKRQRSGAYLRRAEKRAAAVVELTRSGLPIAGLSSIIRHAEKLADKNLHLAAAGAAGIALGLVMPYGVAKVKAFVAAKHKRSQRPKPVVPDVEPTPTAESEADEVASTYSGALAMDFLRSTPTFSPELSARMAHARSQAEFLELVSVQIEALNLTRARVQQAYEMTRRGGGMASRAVRVGASLLEGVPFIGSVVEATQEAVESACDYKVSTLSVEIARLRLLRADLQARVVPVFDREVRLRANTMALAVSYDS